MMWNHVLQLYASYKGQAWVDENNHIIDDEYMLEMYEMMDTVVKISRCRS